MSTATYTLIDFPAVAANRRAEGRRPVLLARQLWAGHDGDQLLANRDRYLPRTRSGWIDVTATTLTPLFIGGSGDTHTDAGRTIHHTTKLPDGTPIIPDSNLQGMLRHYLRILTGGRVGPINTPVLFFRAPIPPNTRKPSHATDVVAVKHEQYKRRIGGTQNTRPGLFSYDHHGQPGIRPTGPVLTITLNKLRSELARRDNRARAGVQLGAIPATDDTPYIPAQQTGAVLGQRVFAAVHRTALNPGWDVPHLDRHTVLAVTTHTDHQTAATQLQAVTAKQTPAVDPADYTVREVIIWITGRIGPRRANAYLFPVDKLQQRLPVPQQSIDLLESADQITHWQEQNFPTGPTVKRRIKGALDTTPDHDQPVWYTSGRQGNTTVVTSFGRSGGYRVTCAPGPIHADEKTPSVVLDAIPEDLRPQETVVADTIDVPDALLGSIGWGSTDTGLPRRVHCSTLTATDPAPTIDPIQVQLLSAQRGCFVNYLAQPITGDIVTYASEHAHLRGYKQYWHRWDSNWITDLQSHLPQIAGQGGGTDRWVAPLPPGVTFAGRITFTNLTDPELGALLTALQLANTDNSPDPTSAHKIGMGKALGLGSIHLATTVHLTDPHKRYLTWPAMTPANPDSDETATIINAFKQAHINHDNESRSKPRKNVDAKDWAGIRRIRQLLAATSWRDRPTPDQTAPMLLDSYKAFEVLPDALDVIRPTT